MKATRFCLSVVRRGQPVAPPKMGPDVDEVSAFLVSHMENLREGATTGLAPFVTFRDPDDRVCFGMLSDGSDADFLTAAEALTRRLHAEMSHVNSKPGVLVCATFEEGHGRRSGAALKLEVVSDHGAILEQLETGEVVLSAVERVLDRPGELQKGLIYPDERPGSDAVVGDKANQTEARYFLLAMGVIAEEHAKRALGVVAEALVDAAGTSQTVTTVLERLSSADVGTLEDVVTQVTDGIALNLPVEEIINDLAARERPVRQVDTRATLKTTIEAGTVKVDLKNLDLGRVTFRESSEGGWDIIIHVDTMPRLRPRS